MLRPVTEMRGFTVNGLDDDVGKLDDFYFDDQEWGIRYLIVDTGPWLFGRKVLISPVAVESIVWESETIHLELTKEQVEESPEIDLAKPVSRQQFIDLHEYYSWPPYWAPSPAVAGGFAYSYPYPAIWPGLRPEAVEQQAPKAKAEAEGQGRGSPHLRSIKEVDSYHIHATDGAIGHVADFFVDEESWLIHYLLVDTRNILPGREVLISPEWIDHVSWAERTVYVDVTREQVKDSPEYDPAPEESITRDYEMGLFEHYGYRGYWTRA